MTILAVVALLLVGGVGAWYLFRNHSSQPVSPNGPVPPVSSEKDANQATDLYRQGMDAAHNDQQDLAGKTFEQITRQFPDTWAAKKAWLQLGDIYLQQSDKKKALDAFQKGLEAADETTRSSVEQAIATLKAQIEHAEQPALVESVYTVRPGDSLSSIARQFNTHIELIKLANNQLKDDIAADRTLKITTIMPEIQVDRQKYQLTLFWKSQPLRTFAIGIGKDDSTPVGEFVVHTKQKNPSWWRNNHAIPFGSPDNILGTRWMGLKDAPGHSGYGIHGTTQPDSIPGPTSAGCIRMLNRDVEELFEWVPIGTKVTVK